MNGRIYSKYKAKQILPFGIIWLFLGTLFLTIEHLALGDQANALDSAIKLEPDIVLFALFGIAIIGLLMGTIEVLVLQKLFERKKFSTKIITKFFIYTLFFFFAILITFPVAASIEMHTSITDKSVWDKYIDFFFSITHLSTVIQLGFSLFISLLYAEISNHLGQNVLLNFFTGKYHAPVVEERIFMFVDMKNSTDIAEKIGHQKYFELLRSYYYSFSNAIIGNQGEVYQYVGDEIVITWKLGDAGKNMRCVHCFFDMRRDLLKEKETFLKKFGVVPDFKAALHVGQVTTGEIGALKKDIFFTGDVLNTTSRILGLANGLDEYLLVSEFLSKKIDLPSHYKFIAKGKHSLKGKVRMLSIFAIRQKEFT